MRRQQFGAVRTILVVAIATVGWGGMACAGELDGEQDAWYQKYKKQANVPQPQAMLLNVDPEPDLEEGYTSLFNGKNLDGWTSQGGVCTFAVKDGAIVGECVEGSNSTYLCTDRTDFTDFVFTCEMRWELDCNSGVMFRARTKPSSGQFATVYGPQAEMEGTAKERGWSGGVYGQSCGGYYYPLWLKEHREARDALKPEGWNRVTVMARGDVVKTWVNGVPAAHWVDHGEYPQGFFGLQVHKGKSGKVLWKNLRIKELSK